MKLKLQKYEIIKYTKKGKDCKIIFEEKEDGVNVTDTEDNINFNLGNFILRFISIDENKDNYNDLYIYKFKLYISKNHRYKECKIFEYKRKERLTTELIENKCCCGDYTGRLNTAVNGILKYFKEYLNILIEKGITVNRYIKNTDNEYNTKRVKEYMEKFMQLIDGGEDVYIENSFDYNKNKKYYDENNIHSNKDIFLINRNKDKNYKDKMIGYVTYTVDKGENGKSKLDENGNPKIKQEYYYIHIPTLINVMEKEYRFPEKITSQVINIGLKKLELIDNKPRINCKTCDGKLSVLLTKLCIDKLKELDLEGKFLKEFDEEQEIQGKNEKEQEENNCLTFKTGAGFEVSCGLVAVENKDNIMPQYPQYSNYQEPQQLETRQTRNGINFIENSNREVVTFDKPKFPIKFLDEE